jgi:hypothetical protein
VIRTSSLSSSRPAGWAARAAVAAAAVLAASAAVLGLAPPAVAHGPDPLLGSTPWGQNQVVPYQWTPGQVPPAWLASAINSGASDSNATRKSQAAVFKYASSAPSDIAYGNPVPCSSYGIACMNRTGVPVSFAGMWFRPHGAILDWGTLRWCQAQSTPTNGCYDARRVALDEFGHIQMLGHHVNYADESDYLDAIVQFAGRSRAKEGWDAHVYGRCDVARLQLEYELISAADPVSTCLDLSTSLTIAADPSTVAEGSSVRMTGELEIASATAAKRLSGDPLSKRVVTLQQRQLGATTWSTVLTMTSITGANGSYSGLIWPTATADYRLFFNAPSSEGLRDDTSPVLRVTVTYSTPPCLDATKKVGGAPNQPCL